MEQPKLRPQVNEIVARIAVLYDHSFGEAQKSNLRIDREVMSRITGRKRLDAALLKKVAGKVQNKGMLLADIGGDFMVLTKDSFDTWTRPTESTLDAVAPGTASPKRAPAGKPAGKGAAKARVAKSAKKPGSGKVKPA